MALVSRIAFNLAALAISAALSPACLAIAIWDAGGANDNWTTGANWFALFGPGAPPANNGTEDISMPPLGGVQTSIVDVPYSIRSLTFGSGDGRYVIFGVAELTIGAGGITNNDSDTQSVLGPVKLSAHQAWNAVGGRLQMDVVNLNGFNLDLAGAHQIDLPNVLLGTGMITLADDYTSTVTMTGSGSNTYNGATHINGGTLVLNKTSGAVAIPASLYIESIVRLIHDEQIAAGGFVQVESGGLFDLNGHTETFARLIVSPDGSVTTGAGRLNISQEFQVTGGDVTGNVGLGDVTADVTMDGHVTSSADLIVGDAGTGSLSIRLSSSLSNANGYIGDNAGSTGTVTVDGLGSAWDNTGDLYVGNAGNGTLEISNDAEVFSDIGYIGFAAGSIGEVTVTGAGSRWRNITSTRVGQAGSGTLNVVNGGIVSSDLVSIVGVQNGSTGTVNVDNGSMSTGVLTVGSGGNGKLHINNGGVVMSQGRTYIGGSPDSIGMVTVDGAGSRWISTSSGGNEINVGYEGDGTAIITGGGKVFVQCTLCSQESISLKVGALAGSVGNLVVDGTGSLLRMQNATGNAFLTVGFGGSGTLSVSNGGAVESTGTLSVSEFGILNITSGGQINTNAGGIGTTTIGTALATIDGPGSLWNGGDSLGVGGTLFVNNEGTVQATTVTVFPIGTLRGDGNIDGNVVINGEVHGSLAITGNLQNNGLLAPGMPAGALSVDIDYSQSSTGELLIELASASSFDQLAVTGEATLGGKLDINLVDGFIPSVGQSFTILTADDVDGTFSTETLPNVPSLFFDVIYNAQSVVLTVSSALAGDYNGDLRVDAADYVVWRKTNGPPDGYQTWRTNFGRTAASGSAAITDLPSTATAPEPSTLILVCFTLAIGSQIRRSCRQERFR